MASRAELIAEAARLRGEHGGQLVDVKDGMLMTSEANLARWLHMRLPMLVKLRVSSAEIHVVLGMAEQETDEDLAWLVRACRHAVERDRRVRRKVDEARRKAEAKRQRRLTLGQSTCGGDEAVREAPRRRHE